VHVALLLFGLKGLYEHYQFFLDYGLVPLEISSSDFDVDWRYNKVQ
jgi:hypothetical protein